MGESPAKIFVSYSHRDARSLDEFRDAMRQFDLGDRVEILDDTTIQPGAGWADQVEKSLSSAQVLVLLISAELLASEFFYEVEFPQIINRFRRGDTTVIPVVLRPVVLPSELTQVQSYPLSGGSMAEQKDRYQTWIDVADAIVRVLSDLEGGDWRTTSKQKVAPDPPLNTGQIVRILKRVGFEVQRRSGSHYVLRDDSDPPRTVAVPRKAKSIKGGLLRQILRAAEISESDFRSLVRNGP